MNSLYGVFRLIDDLYAYLENAGFQFTPDGFPVFSKDMFLETIPDMLIPVSHWKDRRIKDKKKTVIVFYCGDQDIYRRLAVLFDEIELYKGFMGVAGTDITITEDMDEEWQDAILLLNHLVMAYMAANGIKIVLNTRACRRQERTAFKGIPPGVLVASGFLGCRSRARHDPGNHRYTGKILGIRPKAVLIYGSCSEEMQEELRKMGQEVIVYKDFRRLCREERS